MSGLSSAEASARLAADGPDELPRAGRRSVLRIAWDVLREPMLALLLAGGVAYLLLGDRTEALILLAFATFSVVVTVVQESRTENVLEALRYVLVTVMTITGVILFWPRAQPFTIRA